MNSETSDNICQEYFIDFLCHKGYSRNPDPTLYSPLPFKTNKEHSTKQGKWSQDEDDLLRSNWQKFKLDYPQINNQHALIFYPSHTPYREYIRKFVRTTKLYERLGRGINRYGENVFWRARNLLGAMEYKAGPLDEKEHENVMRLYENYGPKWAFIATSISRKPDTIRDHMLRHSASWSIGKWDDGENERLTEALREAGHIQGDANDSVMSRRDTETIELVPTVPKNGEIDWKSISAYVGTRDSSQCRMRWLHTIVPKYQAYSNTPQKVPTKAQRKSMMKTYRTESRTKLLKALKKVRNKYADDREVDWAEVSRLAGLEGQEFYLGRMYHYLKRNMIANSEIEEGVKLTFPRIVKILRKLHKQPKNKLE